MVEKMHASPTSWNEVQVHRRTPEPVGRGALPVIII